MKTLESKIEAKRKLIEKHQCQLKELLDSCQHPSISQRSEYHSGDYYSKAYTTYWNQCNVCGKKSEQDIIQHSYYG